MPSPVAVTFMPADVTVWVQPGVTVSEAAHAGGVSIATPCGGRGICGSCGVRVIAGQLAPADEMERSGLRRAPRDVRLACRARVVGPVTVRLLSVTASAAACGPIDIPDDAQLVAGVDLGTTSISAVVVDRTTGREIGRATVPNSQQRFGADVLSRMSAAVAGETENLADEAHRSISQALDEACAGGSSRIGRLVIAGNTVMASLLCGADVTPLSTHPFTIPHGVSALPSTSGLRDRLAPGTEVVVVPPLSGFVGGDVTAGLIATRLAEHESALLVDIGTNAEVVVAENGRLWVCSAAAGPAFEAWGVSCGGPYAPGAVTEVDVADGLPTLRAADGQRPRWFSGAGLVSCLAALRGDGDIDSSGLLGESGGLAHRVYRDAEGVVAIELGDGDSCTSLSQLDVRALQLAKGAVRAAIESALVASGLSGSSLEAVQVAGAFGGALDPNDLVALGVVPESAAHVVCHAGNASMSGALAIALDPTLERAAYALADNVTLVDLALDPAFSSRLMRAVSLEPFDV